MYILSLLKEKTVVLHIFFFYVTAALKKETQQPIF